MLSFRTDVPIAESMRLEECLPPSLRISSPERKQQLVENGVAVWMLVDGELAGEAYGAPASFAQDPDIAPYGSDAICLFGCCIFPEYQGRGYASVLVAYWLGMVRERGFRLVVGHAAHPAMAATVRFLGGEIVAVRDNWGGSGQPGHLFRMVP